jgi:hypothetical protein
MSRFHQQQPQLLPLLQTNRNVGSAAGSDCCGVLTVGSMGANGPDHRG